MQSLQWRGGKANVCQSNRLRSEELCDGPSWRPGKGVTPHQFETQTAMSSQHSISDAGSIPPSGAASVEPRPTTPDSLASLTSRESLEISEHNSGDDIRMEQYHNAPPAMKPVSQSGGDSSGSAGVDAEATEAGGEWIEACCNCLGDVCQFMCSMVFPACDD
jgi:hypothetical protein